jgi:hypothetical protein
MTTFERELTAHCGQILEVLAAADVPCAWPRGTLPTAPDAWVALRPTLEALWVSAQAARWIEDAIRTAPATYAPALVPFPGSGVQVLMVRLHPLSLFVLHGRHPAAKAYWRWHRQVQLALLKHGYYDPVTNHTPPAARQLDAMECREAGRALFNQIGPGFGDVLAGDRPTTAEGRRIFGYLVTDDEGQQHFLRESDRPEAPDEDEEMGDA